MAMSLFEPLHSVLSLSLFKTEKNTIKNILHNNEYVTSLIEKPINQSKQRTDTHTDPQNQKIKWVTFTYYGKETRKITKIFRDTELKVAYRTRNTVSNN
jgi:hypothetical protein